MAIQVGAVTVIDDSRNISGVGMMLTNTLDLQGNYTLEVNVVAGSTIDCSLGNFFTKTISGITSFTFTNVPSNRAYGFILELTNGGSSVVSWPVTVKWPNASAPALTASGVDVLSFITDDGGTTWRGVLSMGNSS